MSLLHVKDTISGAHFLIDTGAEVSIVPPTASDLHRPPNLALVAANGLRIKSFGTRQMTLKVNGVRYNWRFQIADVNKPIIGADFIRAFNLLVDLTGRRLVQPDGPSSIRESSGKSPQTFATSFAPSAPTILRLSSSPDRN